MGLFKIYSKMPVALQQLAVSLYSYKVKHERFGGEFYEIYNRLLESDNWSAEQVLKYKEENTSRIIKHAYEHCLFYRELYDQHGVSPKDFTCMEDLKKFPIVTKEMLKIGGVKYLLIIILKKI